MNNNVTSISTEPLSIVGCERIGTTVHAGGRKIPKMYCIERDDDIEVILDERFSYTFPKELAYDIVCFAANAMAIGAGFTSMESESFAPKLMRIDTVL